MANPITSRNRRTITEVLESLTYKPGWKFELISCTKKQFTIYVSFEAHGDPTGTHTNGESITVQQRWDIALGGMLCTKAQIREGLYKAVLGLETHELQEWLKFDGICHKDPHPEVKR